MLGIADACCMIGNMAPPPLSPSVDLAPVLDIDNENHESFVLYVAHDPVITHAIAPQARQIAHKGFPRGPRASMREISLSFAMTLLAA